jgi:hypothetical protein
MAIQVIGATWSPIAPVRVCAQVLPRSRPRIQGAGKDIRILGDNQQCVKKPGSVSHFPQIWERFQILETLQGFNDPGSWITDQRAKVRKD